MSQENVDLVRRVYAELGPYPAQVDPAAFARFAAPDVELDLSAVYSDAPRVRGLEAAIGLTQSLPWGSSTKLEPERFFDVDDERVLVFMRVTAKGEGSGVPVELRDAHEITIRDGLCTRIKVYLDRTEALEAAGLREQAMSEEIDERVRRGYDAWNRRDFDAALALADPEIEWTMIGTTRFMAEGTYHGHDGVREFWRLLIEPWAELHIEVEGTRAAGDLVVAFVRFRAKGRDGLELEAPFVHLLDFRDGKWIRFRSFDNRADALEVAGFSE